MVFATAGVRVEGEWGVRVRAGPDPNFPANAFAFDRIGLRVMEGVAEDGSGDAGVVIEDLGPVFVSLVGGDFERIVSVPLTDGDVPLPFRA